jgi:tRNA uridine 5-carboxymethylaminomethyl modification enzyme
LKIKGKEPFILSRADSYIGVLIDDITTMEWNEPYRMFTSRAEYRLFLRADNAEQRLCEKAHNAGMLTEEEWKNYTEEKNRIETTRKILGKKWLLELKKPSVIAEEFFSRVCPELPLTRKEKWHILSEELYSGFLIRAAEEIASLQKAANLKIPPDFDYSKANVLSIEARQKLAAAMPLTLGAAARVAGVRAGDIAVLRRIILN